MVSGRSPLNTCLVSPTACTIVAMKTLPLKIILLVAALWLPLSVHAAKNILVFGDSLSAGYGIAVAESWVNLLQQELARSHPDYRVVNASISGEPTQGGPQRITGALQQYRPAGGRLPL